MKRWRSVLEENISPLPQEILPIADVLGRIAAAPVFAALASPAHSESLRDGFLCYVDELDQAVTDGLPIVFEVAAGKLNVPQLARRTVHRIFTGGLIAGETSRLCVIPQEFCREEKGRFFLEKKDGLGHLRFIAEQGDDFTAGVQLAEPGQRLDGWLLARLISGGVKQVAVTSLPQVSLCCTGSELVPFVDGERQLLPGEKYSVNELIIRDGVECCGAQLTSYCMPDAHRALADFFWREEKNCDLLITCGGTGPGKYDMVRSVLLAAGGSVVLDSPDILPLQKVIFGQLGGTPVLCLPGPPRAVATLLHEAVVPVVCLLAGKKDVWPKCLKALFMPEDKELEEVRGEKVTAFPRLRPGVFSCKDGKCRVVPVTRAGKMKRMVQANCHILYPAKRLVHKGDLVDVHMIRSSFGNFE